MEFKANTVTLDEGPPVVLSFADNSEKPREYVILSFDPDEREQGGYLEVNGQIRSGYNLITKIECLASALVIHVTAEGEKVVKSNGSIMVSISRSVVEWPSVRSSIKKLFSESFPVTGE